MRQHVDEGVDRETINLAALELTDARLRDSKKGRGIYLRHVADNALEGAHQVRAKREILRFAWREAKVGEHVPARRGRLPNPATARRADVRVSLWPLHLQLGLHLLPPPSRTSSYPPLPRS